MYKVSMKVSPLGKKALFFNFQKKKRPYRANLLEMYQGSLQLEAEGSPTPDTKLCPLSYPFPVARR